MQDERFFAPCGEDDCEDPFLRQKWVQICEKIYEKGIFFVVGWLVVAKFVLCQMDIHSFNLMILDGFSLSLCHCGEEKPSVAPCIKTGKNDNCTPCIFPPVLLNCCHHWCFSLDILRCLVVVVIAFCGRDGDAGGRGSQTLM